MRISMKNTIGIILMLALLLPALATAKDVKNTPKKDKSMIVIKGEALYRERMALPPDAQLEVTLSEAPSGKFIASSKVNFKNRQVPLPFSLTFPAQDINPSQQYALVATISAANSPLFKSPEPFAIEPGKDHKKVKLLLHRVFAEGTDAASTIEKGAVTAEKELKTAFTDAYWKIKSLGKETVHVFDNQTEPHIYFDKNGSMHGSDGCNRFFGSWAIEGAIESGALLLTPAGSTMMACPQGMEQAQKLMQNQTQVNNWKKSDNFLLLMNNKDVVLTLERNDF